MEIIDIQEIKPEYSADKKFTYEKLIDDVFVYKLETQNSVKHTTDLSGKLTTEFIKGKTLKVNINVPQKKIVVDGNGVYDYNEALLIFNSNFIKNHTLVVDDVDKFEETHKIGYEKLITEWI